MISTTLAQTLVPVGTNPAPVLAIDLAAVASNYRRLRAWTRGVECSAVVKADAYGLGAGPVARALWSADCRLFFVATLEEAGRLRADLPEAEIAVLNGLTAGAEEDFRALRLVPVLSDAGQVERWSRRGRARRLPGILQVDTGLGRLGLTPREVLELDLGRLANIDLRAVLSHLGCAEDPRSPENARQRESFESACAALPAAPRSLAASAGIFLGRDYHCELLRPGIALYGVQPAWVGPRLVQPAVRLTAPILSVRTLPTGAAVGYGATYRCARPTRLATLGLGYADGLPLGLGACGRVCIGGQLAPIVGQISMDLTTVDVTDVRPDALREGIAVIVGGELSLEQVAWAAGSHCHALLTGIGPRVRREYTAGGSRCTG